MNWVIFLHFYQPSSQKREIVENVVNSAYRPILSLIAEYPSARVSININACLTEQLETYGFNDVLESLKSLAAVGKIEFVASSKNHVFLPLIPEYEIELEMKEGLESNRRILGEIYRPQGFFPTELGISRKVAKVAKQQGFAHIIADEISFDGCLSNDGNRSGWWSKVYRAAGTKGLNVVFANRFLCDLIRGQPDLEVSDFQRKFTDLVGSGKNGQRRYIVSAHDAEAFGHHWQGRHQILKWVFEKAESPDLSLITFTDLLSQNLEQEEVELFKGSWETSAEDLKVHRPFPLWYDPDNPIHQCQWQLVWKAIESLHRAKKRGEDPQSETYQWARRHLTRGLHSCYFWWASCKPWWNPDMIISGATELVKVIRTLNSLEPREKTEVEEYYVEIVHLVWQWHWGGEAQRRINAFGCS